jgi:hypothetical protein
MWHVWGTAKAHTGCLYRGNLKERKKLEDLSVNGKILKCIFEKQNGRV